LKIDLHRQRRNCGAPKILVNDVLIDDVDIIFMIHLAFAKWQQYKNTNNNSQKTNRQKQKQKLGVPQLGSVARLPLR